MKKMCLRKWMSAILALSMVVGLSACGNEEVNNKSTEDSTNQIEVSSDSSSTTDDQSVSNESEEKEHITIKWITQMVSDMPGAKETVEAMNEYLEDKLNITLDVTFIPSGEYNEQIKTIVASGSDWDLTSVGGNTFVNFASSGAFMELDEYVDEYLAGAKEALPEAVWDAYTINGQIYGVGPNKDLAERWGVSANQSLIEDTGVSFPTDTYWTTMDLVDWFYDLKEARDEKYPQYANVPVAGMPNFLSGWFYFDALVGTSAAPVVGTNIAGLPGYRDIADDYEVFCPYYTGDFKKAVKELSKLIKDGVIATASDWDPGWEYAKAGKTMSMPGVGLVEVDPNKSAYYTSALYAAKGAVLTTSAAQVSGFVVNSECEYPERVLEFVDLLYTDEYLATTVRFGVEGKDWTDNDNDGVIELGERNSNSASRYWYNWYGYWFGNLLATKTIPGTTDTFMPKLEELNNSAVVSQNMGFIANTDNVVNEVAACNSVIAEYMSQFKTLTGQENIDELCENFVTKLKANGMDKIVEEIQKQLDDWRNQ